MDLLSTCRDPVCDFLGHLVESPTNFNTPLLQTSTTEKAAKVGQNSIFTDARVKRKRDDENIPLDEGFLPEDLEYLSKRGRVEEPKLFFEFDEVQTETLEKSITSSSGGLQVEAKEDPFKAYWTKNDLIEAMKIDLCKEIPNDVEQLQQLHIVNKLKEIAAEFYQKTGREKTGIAIVKKTWEIQARLKDVEKYNEGKLNKTESINISIGKEVQGLFLKKKNLKINAINDKVLWYLLNSWIEYFVVWKKNPHYPILKPPVKPKSVAPILKKSEYLQSNSVSSLVMLKTAENAHQSDYWTNEQLLGLLKIQFPEKVFSDFEEFLKDSGNLESIAKKFEKKTGSKKPADVICRKKRAIKFNYNEVVEWNENPVLKEIERIRRSIGMYVQVLFEEDFLIEDIDKKIMEYFKNDERLLKLNDSSKCFKYFVEWRDYFILSKEYPLRCPKFKGLPNSENIECFLEGTYLHQLLQLDLPSLDYDEFKEALYDKDSLTFPPTTTALVVDPSPKDTEYLSKRRLVEKTTASIASSIRVDAKEHSVSSVFWSESEIQYPSSKFEGLPNSGNIECFLEGTYLHQLLQLDLPSLNYDEFEEALYDKDSLTFPPTTTAPVVDPSPKDTEYLSKRGRVEKTTASIASSIRVDAKEHSVSSVFWSESEIQYPSSKFEDLPNSGNIECFLEETYLHQLLQLDLPSLNYDEFEEALYDKDSLTFPPTTTAPVVDPSPKDTEYLSKRGRVEKTTASIASSIRVDAKEHSVSSVFWSESEIIALVEIEYPGGFFNHYNDFLKNKSSLDEIAEKFLKHTGKTKSGFMICKKRKDCMSSVNKVNNWNAQTDLTESEGVKVDLLVGMYIQALFRSEVPMSIIRSKIINFFKDKNFTNAQRKNLYSYIGCWKEYFMIQKKYCDEYPEFKNLFNDKRIKLFLNTCGLKGAPQVDSLSKVEVKKNLLSERYWEETELFALMEFSDEYIKSDKRDEIVKKFTEKTNKQRTGNSICRKRKKLITLSNKVRSWNKKPILNKDVSIYVLEGMYLQVLFAQDSIKNAQKKLVYFLQKYQVKTIYLHMNEWKEYFIVEKKYPDACPKFENLPDFQEIEKALEKEYSNKIKEPASFPQNFTQEEKIEGIDVFEDEAPTETLEQLITSLLTNE